MKNKIRLGKAEDGKELLLDVDKFIESRMVIQGSSGAGKSGLIRVLCEQVSKSVPVIVLDREGEFATLREKVDLILVGANGDIPTDLRSAEVLARKLVELRASAVIDLSDLKTHLQREFVRRFCEALVSLPKELWHPLVVVIDEAQLFCPEKGSAGRDIVSTQAVIDLIAQGRKRGFATVLGTQRFSKVHNDALAELKNVFIGNTWLDADQKKAGDYLGLLGNDRRELREIPNRTFHCFGPALSIKGVSKMYVDTAETTFPKAGQIQDIKLPKASDAITQILGQLDDLPEVAEQEKKDIASLQLENRGLKKQLAERPTVPEPVETIKEVQVEVPVMPPETIQAAETLADAISNKIITFIQDLNVHVGELEHVRDEILAAVAKISLPKAFAAAASVSVDMAPGKPNSYKAEWKPGTTLDRPAPESPKTLQTPPESTQNLKTPVISSTDSGLTGPQQKILDTLRGFEAIGQAHMKRANLAAFVGYAETTKSYVNNLGSLRSAGLIEYGAGTVLLTESGRALAGDAPVIADRAGLHKAWMERLNGPQRTMLEILIDAYPQAVLRSDLAERCNYAETTKSFVNGLGNMRSLGVIDYGKLTGDDGRQLSTVYATDLLFPEGLR